jgi:hypothetical protein
MRNLLLFFCLLQTSAFSYFHKKGDFEIWNVNYINYRFFSDAGLRYENEERWGNRASELYFVMQQLQLFYNSTWWEVAGGYRQEYIKRVDEWLPFYAPMGEVSLFHHFDGWSFINRNRLFYFFSGKTRSFWNYRNRTFLSTPEFYKKIRLNFVTFDEVLFQQYFGFFQNRLGAGFESKPLKNLRSRIEYIYLWTKLERGCAWSNVLEFYLDLDF